jgi:hypothetical protein
MKVKILEVWVEFFSFFFILRLKLLLLFLVSYLLEPCIEIWGFKKKIAQNGLLKNVKKTLLIFSTDFWLFITRKKGGEGVG